MKKRAWFFSFLIMISLFGCSKASESLLKTGSYSLQTTEDEFACASVSLKDNQEFSFVYSVLSSHIFAGNYKIKGNTLILTDKSQEEEKQFFFEIEKEQLIFQAEKSAQLPDFAKNDVYDGVMFVLTEKE